MRTELRKVYFCQHCNKHNLSAAAISRHERFCPNKPENRHICFQECRNLIRTTERIEGRFDRYGFKTIFTCTALNQRMYSYLLEKRIDFRPKFIEGLVRMPLECGYHKYMTELELEKRFNIEL